ncbi:MAG: hypothetical protein ACOYMD_15620 [Paludibacter sp.]|jgi:hypothetical protein
MKKNTNLLSDRDKILKGMEKVYDKLIESKRKNNSEMVVIRNNQIVRIKP